MDDSRRTELLNHRIKLIEIENEQINQFDKSALAISSGAFGLSIIFLEKIVGETGRDNVQFLVVAWMLLLITIMANLTSYLTSWFETRKLIKSIDQTLKGESEEHMHDALTKSYTKYLNFISVASLLLGLAFLAIFAIKNIKGAS